MLYIGSNHFTRIPKNLPKNIQLLNMYGNQVYKQRSMFNRLYILTVNLFHKISNLSLDDLRPYSALQNLDLEQNIIDKIPSNLCSVLPKIYNFYIAFNKLTSLGIPKDAFSGNIIEILRL